MVLNKLSILIRPAIHPAPWRTRRRHKGPGRFGGVDLEYRTYSEKVVYKNQNNEHGIDQHTRKNHDIRDVLSSHVHVLERYSMALVIVKWN